MNVQNQNVMKLAAALADAYKYMGTDFKADTTPGMTPIYARNGLFGVCGAESTLINAMVAPMGIERIIPFVASEYDNPIYDALTYIGTSGTAQEDGCADCGKPNFKECSQTACFGRMCQQTHTMQFDEVNRVMNRGVNRVALNGAITGPGGQVIVAQGQPITDQWMLNIAGAAYSLRMDVGQRYWDGNPAANLGGRRQFPGFQLLVNTGKYDALTGQLCPALDSELEDYGSFVVGAPGSPNVVTYLAGLVRSISYRISGMNRNPDGADIRLAMRPEVFEQLAEAWACSYGLVCQRGSVRNERNDSLQLANLRDQFLRTRTLPIDGKDYPVEIDNLIPYTTSLYDSDIAKCSDIYVLTMSLDGGERNIWGEYLDLNFAGGTALSWMQQMFGTTRIAVTDGGRFAVAMTESGGFCFDARILTLPRLLVLMPQLCGRLQNVCAVSIGNYPDPTGSGFLYEVDGGTPSKPYLELYSECDGYVPA